MATYVYHCYECEYDKEVVHGMTESPEVVCKDCAKGMHKVIRSSNFQLKGSGWFGKSKQH